MTSKFLYTVSAVVFLLAGCKKLEYQKDPNNPTVESVLNGASRVQIAQLGIGAQAVTRNGHFSFYSWSASVGREMVYFAKTESRYYRELQGGIPIDNAGIMYDWWFSFNQTRRRAEILLQSAQNTSELSAAEKSAVKGMARTIQAYVMLNALNMSGPTGIRTSFSDLASPGDLLKPGCFKTYAEGLTYVKGLVEEGKTALDAGGTAFPYSMIGFTGFNTPTLYKRFNRAVAARVAMYQQDWAGVLSALNESYLDLNGSMSTGPQFTYSTTAGDATNPMWQIAEENNAIFLAQSTFVTQAEVGDNRVFGAPIGTTAGGTAKVRLRTTATAPPSYPNSTHEVQMYRTNTSPITIIRNEELILMYAEAKIRQGGASNLSDAVIALDKVRAAAGLGTLGAVKPTIINDQNLLTDELLLQRRYGLFMEGHRWFDMRRYNRLGSLPLDVTGHQVWANFPKHRQEIDWDASNPCQ
jgi:starch-binding outer membrane protein, SusD/RagB family